MVRATTQINLMALVFMLLNGGEAAMMGAPDVAIVVKKSGDATGKTIDDRNEPMVCLTSTYSASLDRC